MSNENEVNLSIIQEDNKEVTSVFLLEDLIKEYNSKIINDPICRQMKKYPLSLRPYNVSSNYPTISAMTKAEVDSMRLDQYHMSDQTILKNILSDQITPKGLVNNIPNLAAGVSMAQVVNELGLKGKVTYKTVGNKTYVYVKGYPGLRSTLRGTRYLNTHPQIVEMGLSKVSVPGLIKTGFKTSFWVYGVAKIVEALYMIVEDGELKSSFFSEIPTDITKLAINAVVTAAAAGVVALVGIPVGIGLGIVLAVSIVAGIGLDYIDKKTGLTEKLTEATDKMWENLKEKMNIFLQNQQKSNLPWDPLEGLIFGGPFARSLRIMQSGNHLVYTA